MDFYSSIHLLFTQRRSKPSNAFRISRNWSFHIAQDNLYRLLCPYVHPSESGTCFVDQGPCHSSWFLSFTYKVSHNDRLISAQELLQRTGNNFGTSCIINLLFATNLVRRHTVEMEGGGGGGGGGGVEGRGRRRLCAKRVFRKPSQINYIL